MGEKIDYSRICQMLNAAVAQIREHHGHLSQLEKQQLPQAFGAHTLDYMNRIRRLRDCMVSGQIHAAKQLCQLDYLAG